MPYDQKDLLGLDSLSPTIAAYKQFVERQNNVGDGQVVQFLASRGEPQLAGLIAKKLRVENAAKAQQQLAQQPKAAPPTVADQYNMAEQQQAQQAMMAQMAQMQAAQQAQAAPGLAGMPNPVMDRASFAGGGIVAMAGGGDVQHFAVGGDDGLARLRAANYPGVQPFSPEERESYALSQVGGVAPEAPTPEEIDLVNKYYRPLSGISSYVDEATKAKATAAKAKIDAYREYQKLGGGKSAPLPAAPAQTAASGAGPTGGIASTLSLDEFKNKYHPAQQAAPTALTALTSPTDKTTSTTKKTPAATTKQTLAGLLEDPEGLKKYAGEKPEAFASRPLDKTPYLNEEKFIENQIMQQGVDEKEARKNFWIMAGASLLGSRDPNFMNALGTAVKENYGNMISDLRTLKKEHDALSLQKIKLDQAMALAQRTQDEKDRDRADTLSNAYQNRVSKYYDLQEEGRQKALDRQSAETRTTTMYGDRNASAEQTRQMNAAKAAIAAAEKELAGMGKFPSQWTLAQQAKAQQLNGEIRANKRKLFEIAGVDIGDLDTGTSSVVPTGGIKFLGYEK